jgi:hypothetical protein
MKPDDFTIISEFQKLTRPLSEKEREKLNDSIRLAFAALTPEEFSEWLGISLERRAS